MENVADIYPLTPVQQGMLYHTISEPDSEIYFEQIRCNLVGPLNVDGLISAWDYVVKHYPALRTAFIWEGLDEPLQVVRQATSPEWEVLDWRDNRTDTTAQLDQLAQDNRRSGFDIANAPLLRFVLVQTSEESHHFIWNFHHLLLDGWSTHQVLYDAFAIYEMLDHKQQPFLPPTRPFRNYIAWLKKQDIGAAENFWRKKLAGFSAPTPLQVDLKSSDTGILYGELAKELSSATSAALQQFARDNRITLNTVVQGAWALLLSRYSGQDDVVFGNTVSGRSAAIPGVEKMVGMCINTLPVRVELSSEQRLLPWLQKLQEQLLAMRRYEYSPLAKIQKWSDIAPGQALFDSIVVFENYPDSDKNAQRSLQIHDIQYRELSNYPLALLVLPGAQLRLLVIYNRNRFDADTIERLLSHLQTILEAMASRSQQMLTEIPMLGDREKEQLLVDWNQTYAHIDSDAPLFNLVTKHAELRPEATVVVAQDGLLTYAQLNERANQLAHNLIKKGIEPGTPVGLFMERSLAMLVGIIGIQKAGGAYVPLDAAYPAERIALILQDTQTPVIVTQADIAGQLPATMAEIIKLDNRFLNLDEFATAVPETTVTLDDLAYIIYTSGSTGTPKGVMVTHGNLLASTLARKATYEKSAERFLLLSSFAFDSSVVGLFWSLASGGTIVLPAPDEEKDVAQLATIIDREQVTHTLALPALYRLLLKYAPQHSLDSLQEVIVAGEACPQDLGQIHYELLPHSSLYNEYGPTEATVWCSVYKLPPHSEGSVVPIGRPIANSQLYILDQCGQPVPIGVPGELYVGGAGVTLGYWNNPQLTAERFPQLTINGYDNIGRVYRTGDLACWRADGQIEFLGRVDNQIKIRGFRVELGEIEAQLRRHPAVEETVVNVWDTSENGSEAGISLVAYVVSINGNREEIDGASLQDYLSDVLPDYMVPRQVVFLSSLPRTPNGKIDLRQLPSPTLEADRKRPFIPPQSDIEKKMAAIWCEILRLPEVSIEDRFFELGGDSILAIQVVARLRQEGHYLTPRQLFTEQTIKRLAAIVVSEAGKSTVAIDDTGSVPLTPIQHWFFAQELSAPAHWNQAAWFELSTTIDLEHLNTALAKLVKLHPILGARYVQVADGWRQEIAAEPASPAIAQFSLTNLDFAAQDAAMLTKANELHAKMDLANGRLLQGAYINFGHGRRPRLLLIIHHLAVDAVSWAFIVSDLETALRQSAGNKVVTQPDATTSYAQWAKLLPKLAQSEKLRREAAYWQQSIKSSTAFPQDNLNGMGNPEGQAGLITVSLDKGHTEQLLRDVHEAYHTRIDDLLLTALVQTMAHWTDDLSLLLTWERHGREALDERLDVSQTVGWFTSLTPVTLNLAGLEDLGANLRAVKEQIRNIPQSGIGFGLLRYLGDEALQQQLASLPRPQILFNNLGQMFNTSSEGNLLRPLIADTGMDYGPSNERVHLIDVNAMVTNGRLEVNWQYASSQFQAETIQSVANTYITELVRLIEHCIEDERSQHTPSDFPLAKLQQDDLDSLSDLLAELD